VLDAAGGATEPLAAALVCGHRLRVNPISCVAHGLCAELLPELVELDEWGYPVIDRAPVPVGLVAQARRVVAACPALALRLDGRRGRPGGRAGDPPV
jgi:ferredoxin